MKTKTEIKQTAQDELMAAMQVAFLKIADTYSAKEAEIMRKEASKQMARVEKLFGYTVESWTRGC